MLIIKEPITLFVNRYLARVAATYLGQQHSAVRQMEVHGNPAFGVEVPKDDGRLIHVWYRQSAHVKYVTYYFAKDPAKAADENLVYTAQMPQKVGGDAGASSSSSKAKKK